MIVDRYLQRNVHFGTLGTLFVLVGLSLFFVFVRELDEIGEGSYALPQVVQYLLLSIPGMIVEFMPLAVLLGSILSLGALAGNSEIIAMMASGVSLSRLLAAVLQAALLLAVGSYLLADWVVPASEAAARNLKHVSQKGSSALQDEQGLWIKDGERILRVGKMLPNGYASEVEVYRLDADGGLVSMTRAESAIPVEEDWVLQQAQTSTLSGSQVTARQDEHLPYRGNLSRDLLRVLMIEPRQMSTPDLYAYLEFLDRNRLQSGTERLVFWQKLLAPVSILVMALLAIPFLLGSQRQGNTGHRLMTGIVLGLAFVVVDRLAFQLGNQFQVNPLLIASLPSLLFLWLALWLLFRRQWHLVLFGRAR